MKCSGEPAFGLDDIYELGLKYEAELPGWAPETLWNGELLFLATAYKNLDLSAQVTQSVIQSTRLTPFVIDLRRSLTTTGAKRYFL